MNNVSWLHQLYWKMVVPNQVVIKLCYCLQEMGTSMKYQIVLDFRKRVVMLNLQIFLSMEL